MSERRLEDTEDGVLVRRALSRFGVSILATMAVLLVAAYVVGGRLAQHQALRDARIQASALSDNLVAPLVDSDVRAHLPGAAASLDRELARRVRHGDIRHVKVWTAQGEVLWSDETQLIGRTFELPADVRETVRTGRPVAEVSELSRAENAHEKDEGRLLEVYTASRGVDGRPVLFEAYFDTERLDDDRRRITTAVVAVAAGVVVLFAAAVLPLGVSLARRVERGRAARLRLTQRALSASDRERRLIAQELHDGVIQDLAGIVYLLPDLRQRAAEGSTDDTDASTLTRIDDLLSRDIASLRSMLVEVYPPTLEGSGLRDAIEDFARLAMESGLEVDVSVAPDLDLPRDTGRLAYAVVREGLRNSVRHSGGTRVLVNVERDHDDLVVVVLDDGRGLPEGGELQAAEGHFGLRLLTDALEDIGGTLTLGSHDDGGARLEARFPAVPSRS